VIAGENDRGLAPDKINEAANASPIALNVELQFVDLQRFHINTGIRLNGQTKVTRFRQFNLFELDRPDRNGAGRLKADGLSGVCLHMELSQFRNNKCSVLG
jgi:hypothetical protein